LAEIGCNTIKGMHRSISQIMDRAYNAAQYQGLGYSAFNETDYGKKEFKRTMLGNDSYSKVLKKAKEINDPPILEYSEYDMHSFDKMEFEANDYTEHKVKAERNGIQIKRSIGYQDYYDTTQQSRMKEETTVYRFDDVENGYHLDFTYEESSMTLKGKKAEGDIIHVMIIKCAPERQGRYWELKRTLDRFKKMFLDDAGLNYCFGRVVPDNQYAVKKTPHKSGNWRKKEQKIKNYNTGKKAKVASWKLLNLYLRLGWIYPQVEDEGYPIIFLLSDKFKHEVLADGDMGSWLLDRYKFSRT
jgi:hypothetical protein